MQKCSSLEYTPKTLKKWGDMTTKYLLRLLLIMYRELARAREISKVTKTGALTLGETGKAIKKAY